MSIFFKYFLLLFKMLSFLLIYFPEVYYHLLSVVIYVYMNVSVYMYVYMYVCVYVVHLYFFVLNVFIQTFLRFTIFCFSIQHIFLTLFVIKTQQRNCAFKKSTFQILWIMKQSLSHKQNQNILLNIVIAILGKAIIGRKNTFPITNKFNLLLFPCDIVRHNFTFKKLQYTDYKILSRKVCLRGMYFTKNINYKTALSLK